MGVGLFEIRVEFLGKKLKRQIKSGHLWPALLLLKSSYFKLFSVLH